MLTIITIYYAAVSIAAFMMVGVDKGLARRGLYRVAERRIFAAAALGGWAGVLIAMALFRNKTRKKGFRETVYICVALNLVMLALALYLAKHSSSFQALVFG